MLQWCHSKYAMDPTSGPEQALGFCRRTLQDSTSVASRILERDMNSRCMRVVLVDSSENQRRHVRSMLATIADVEVVAEAGNTSDARRLISELKPDLLFMDVAMPDGNCFDLLRELHAPPQVIFFTADRESAVAAFDAQAVDYVIRPAQRQRIAESVRRAMRRIAENRIAGLALSFAGAASALDAGQAGMSPASAPEYPDQITIRIRRRMIRLDVADIIWVQGASQYSRVHARTGEFLLARSLSALAGELDPKRFLRIHKSSIVNAAHVQEIRSSGEGRYSLYLRGGPSLPVGRSRRAIVRSLLARQQCG